MELGGAGYPLGAVPEAAGAAGDDRRYREARAARWFWGLALVGLLAGWLASVPAAASPGQILSLEAAEQLMSQAFHNLRPAPAWQARLRLAPDETAPVLRATARGIDGLRLEEPGEPPRVHVWNRGYAYVRSGNEERLRPSQELLAVYREALLPFLFLDQVAADPVVGAEPYDGGWSVQVRDGEMGLLWVDVRAGLPVRIRQADGVGEGGTAAPGPATRPPARSDDPASTKAAEEPAPSSPQVLWEVERDGAGPDTLRVRFALPGQPAGEWVLERLATGWVSRGRTGAQWLDRKPADPPEEAAFRPGLLGELLAALDRSQAAQGAGRVGEARQALREAIRLDPYRPALYTQLGVFEVGAGNWQGALAAFDQAFQLDPDDPLLVNNLAYVLIDAGLDPHRGVALAEQAVERRPQEASFLDTLGWGYVRTGRLEEGVEILRRAHGLAETAAPAVRAEIAYHLADALLRLGRSSQARELLEEALELNPSLEAAQRLRERLT
ncbi:tetratricopeptide repeat protein [Limnochorda pilosa]|uniref:Uncharacterized protein n=1 Tax=Limnochorda pilosa TaxID=1555112 RepID=A0A0K2SIZ9_LIMPI|nr:tetratricopeptide repeat protein [Limnochorda pilosa]BAS27078.1 hypothetical protein LIP_1221 [Limnochorda pilosa]